MAKARRRAPTRSPAPPDPPTAAPVEPAVSPVPVPAEPAAARADVPAALEPLPEIPPAPAMPSAETPPPAAPAPPPSEAAPPPAPAAPAKAEPDRLEPDPKLDPERIIDTVHALHARIEERFPGSGLGRVAAELLRIARLTVERVAWVSRPNRWLRAGVVVLILFLVALTAAFFFTVNPFAPRGGAVVTWADFLQAIEAGINDVLLIGAAIYFLVTAEGRIKRRRALGFLREFRAVAHIVDMHQLTKDPDAYLHPGQSTPSSPRRTMTPYELSRYLDYCSEMLALNSKLASLYAQNMDDPVVLAAVDEVETLTTGLSGKVWQKMVIVAQARPGGSA